MSLNRLYSLFPSRRTALTVLLSSVVGAGLAMPASSLLEPTADPAPVPCRRETSVLSHSARRILPKLGEAYGTAWEDGEKNNSRRAAAFRRPLTLSPRAGRQPGPNFTIRCSHLNSQRLWRRASRTRMSLRTNARRWRPPGEDWPWGWESNHHSTRLDTKHPSRSLSGRGWRQAICNPEHRSQAVPTDQDAGAAPANRTGSKTSIPQAIGEDELRQLAAELRQRNADLLRSNQELDSFAYIASHDLKEPLRGIHNYATFLLEDYARQTGRGRSTQAGDSQGPRRANVRTDRLVARVFTGGPGRPCHQADRLERRAR